MCSINKIVLSVIMYVKVHFVTLHSDGGHIMQRRDGARGSWGVMLICGVTDCWRRGHLPSVYFCPSVCAVYMSVCFVRVMPASHYDDQVSSQALSG